MERLTRERVLDAAVELVERDGLPALTMRSLAAELGVAVTAIYWHVGNRDALLSALVDRVGAAAGRVQARGSTPEARVRSVARSLRRNLDAHRHLVAVAHEQGQTEVVFVEARRALRDAFAGGGLRGARRERAVHAVIHLVVGSVLLARATERSPRPDEPHADPDPDATFEHALTALVRGLLAGP